MTDDMNDWLRGQPRSKREAISKRLMREAEQEQEQEPTTGLGLDGGSRGGEGQQGQPQTMNDLIRGSSLAQ
jgi:hypothetical protein